MRTPGRRVGSSRSDTRANARDMKSTNTRALREITASGAGCRALAPSPCQGEGWDEGPTAPSLPTMCSPCPRTGVHGVPGLHTGRGLGSGADLALRPGATHGLHRGGAGRGCSEPWRATSGPERRLEFVCFPRFRGAQGSRRAVQPAAWDSNLDGAARAPKRRWRCAAVHPGAAATAPDSMYCSSSRARITRARGSPRVDSRYWRRS